MNHHEAKRMCFKDAGAKKKRSLNAKEIDRRKQLLHRRGPLSLRRMRQIVEADSPQHTQGRGFLQTMTEVRETTENEQTENPPLPLDKSSPTLPDDYEHASVKAKQKTASSKENKKQKKKKTCPSADSVDLVLLLLEDEERHKAKGSRLLFDWCVPLTC